MEIQKRTYARYSVNLAAYLRCQGTLEESPVRNLSLGGVCIECEQAKDVGEKIELSLSLPFESNTMVILSEVIWVNGENPKEMGLRFLSLHPKEKEQLTSYLEAFYEVQAQHTSA